MWILVHPEDDFLHCASLFKTSPPALKYNKKCDIESSKEFFSEKSKESWEDFVCPLAKTARPASPTKTTEPVETSNNFDQLRQDVEQQQQPDNTHETTPNQTSISNYAQN
ncbi:hypothetical protein TNCV_4843801 [Trichonephila clavipes]|uniref:Uncharacterized protein n=1 Tax=Trichonephila clavipes TaxID=2585209 RepID=A0A8X6WJ36_TRICX|nr:hypothetical protein TNCV_4843801 [Trichonephila clavipes]